MKISLIIATYNWSEPLELVLLSVLKQSHLPEEIIIADDGSTEITKKMTDSFKNKISSEIKHIWHSDDGFQKTITFLKTAWIKINTEVKNYLQIIIIKKSYSHGWKKQKNLLKKIL